MDVLASDHNNKDFKGFWKLTNGTKPKVSISVNVEGNCEPATIVDILKDHFRVDSC